MWRAKNQSEWKQMGIKWPLFYLQKKKKELQNQFKKAIYEELKDRQNIYHTCVCSLRKSGSWKSPLKTWKNRELVLETVTLCANTGTTVFPHKSKVTAHSLHSSSSNSSLFCFYFSSWSYSNLWKHPSKQHQYKRFYMPPESSNGQMKSLALNGKQSPLMWTALSSC